MNSKEEILELLNECFNPRAEEHSSLATQLYFAGSQGSIVTELRRHAHHLIQGRMGTGKTMVLKFLSISCQLHDAKQDQRLRHVGLYIGLSPAWLHSLSFEDSDDPLRATLFDAWLCLFAIECVLREFLELPEPFRSDIRTAKTFSALSSLLEMPQIDTESSLLDYTESERNKIEEYFGSQSTDPQSIQDLRSRNAKRKIRPFFDRLALTLKQIFLSHIDPKAQVFYLLDQFEHCSPKQQASISRLLATSGGQAPFFAKIGCRPHKPLSLLKGVSPQDFRVVPLEMSPESTEYRKLTNEAIERRIKSVAGQLRATQAPEQYVALFGSALALFGNYSFENQWSEFARKNPHLARPHDTRNGEVTAFRALTLNKLPRRYGGLNTIRRLSGGFIRSFLSLVYQVVRVSLDQYHSNTIKERRITLEAQDKAIRGEVQNEFGARLRAILSSSPNNSSQIPIPESRKEQVESLLRRLVRFFHKEIVSEKFEPALLTFQLPFNPADSDYSSLFEVLILLRDLGYLTGDFSAERPILTLSPMVASWLEGEHIEIPPIAMSTLRLSQREAMQLAKPFIQQTSVRHTMKVFYASGWRTGLEQRLLQLLSLQDPMLQEFFSKQGLAFIFGSDPTGGNHAIFEQLFSLIKESNFILAEVSSLNENVAFEIGLARALRKRTYHLVNLDLFNANEAAYRNKRFVDFIEGHHFFKYRTLSESEPDVATLRTALTEVYQHHLTRAQKKRQQKLSLSESGTHNVVPYFHFESSSPAAPWYGDLLRFIRQLRREPLNPGPPNRRRSQFDHYADAIDRSTHVLVDISKKDLFACLLYGYAIGTDRQVLPVWDAKSSAPITDIRGLPNGEGYLSRDHLFEKIIKPWLSEENT